MKNKKIVTLCVSLGLIAATGMGATLAYLTSNTELLRNKFTFSEGINMQLDEDQVDSTTHKILEKNAIIAGEDNGNTYNNVLPSEVLPKDPTVTIEANSPDCYVFVSVKNPSEDVLTLNIDETIWKLEGTIENTKYYVYSEKGQPKVVSSSEKEQRLNEVFTTVTVANISEGELSIDDIEVKASAIQSKVGTENNYNEVKSEGLALLGYNK